MKSATSRRAWSLVAKCRRDNSSHSSVELKTLGDHVIERRRHPSHRLDHAERGAGLGEQVAGVLAALVGVEDHAGHVATANGSGHQQHAALDSSAS